MERLSKESARKYYDTIIKYHGFDMKFSLKVSNFYQIMEKEILREITGKDQYFEQFNWLKNNQQKIQHNVIVYKGISPEIISDIDNLKKWRNIGEHKDEMTYVKYLNHLQTMAQTIHVFSGLPIPESISNILENKIETKNNINKVYYNKDKLNINTKCENIHSLINMIEPNPMKENIINNFGINNGIYIIFENGEKAHNYNRIVYIGTTTGKNTKLADRLFEHYQNEGRSVFRNEIALCHLADMEDTHNLQILFKEDSIYRSNWKKTASNIALKSYLDLNIVVSNYIQNNCTFVAFSLERENCVYWEKRIISTIATCNDCNPSENWLGKKSPKNSISKIWNIRYASNKYCLTDDEYYELENIIKSTTSHNKR